MISITREQFKNALVNGLDIADSQGSPVPDSVIDKLEDMGRTATEFGTNFLSKPVACPMGQLGFYDEEEGVATERFASCFAQGFDEAWLDHVPPNWFDQGEVIQVRG